MVADSTPGPTGLVLNVQRFSLDDGPGIRTTVFLKGCSFRCAWCQNPESIDTRPEVAFRAEQCVGCGACERVCPLSVIALSRSDRIDRGRCDGCGACAQACPSGALWMLGRRYTVKQLLEEVEQDAAFYESSGGGVTLSGGEPTLQFEFALAFLRACKQAGLATAIETNGATTPDRLRRLLPHLDRVYLDLKVADGIEHRRVAGAGNEQTLVNARALVAAGAPVAFRLPVVPALTARQANVRAIGKLLQELGADQVELCPYHAGWEHKLRWLGRGGPLRPELRTPISQAELEAVRSALGERGIRATWRT